MATTYTNVRLSQVKSNGDVAVLYPQNAATDVNLTPTSKMPSSNTTLQKMSNSLSKVAFTREINMMELGIADVPDDYIPDPWPTDIDDEDDYRTDKTLSSQVLNERVVPLSERMVEDSQYYVRIDPEDYTEMEDTESSSEINDKTVSIGSTWSSTQFYTELNDFSEIINTESILDMTQSIFSDYNQERIQFILDMLDDHTVRYKKHFSIKTTREIAQHLGFITYHIGCDQDEPVYIGVTSFPAINNRDGESIACFQRAVIVYSYDSSRSYDVRFYCENEPNGWHRWFENSSL